MERKKREIAESRADSADSQNLGENNSSLRDFAKQNRGNPPCENNAELQGGWLLRNARKSCGLPRRFCKSARNDEFFLDSSPSAQNDNLGKIAESSAESRNNKKGKRGFKRLYNAFFYSLSGLKTAFCEEEAFRQIVLISAILIPLGAYLGENFAEKVLLILPCVMAILAELANSAIENAIDFAGLEIHPFAKNAKDMGSAMQLIACVFMGGVWIFYLTQRFVI